MTGSGRRRVGALWMAGWWSQGHGQLPSFIREGDRAEHRVRDTPEVSFGFGPMPRTL